jgi:hypothetical protein
MKLFLLTTILVTSSIAFGLPNRLHAGYGSSCDKNMAEKFVKLYPKADPAEFCYTVCLSSDEADKADLACFPIYSDSGREAKDLINAIVLPLREDSQIAQVTAMAKSAETFFHFSKALSTLAPVACNAAYDNIKKAEQELAKFKETDREYQSAKFILDREKSFLANTQSFFACKLQDI